MVTLPNVDETLLPTCLTCPPAVDETAPTADPAVLVAVVTVCGTDGSVGGLGNGGLGGLGGLGSAADGGLGSLTGAGATVEAGGATVVETGVEGRKMTETGPGPEGVEVPLCDAVGVEVEAGVTATAVRPTSAATAPADLGELWRVVTEITAGGTGR